MMKIQLEFMCFKVFSIPRLPDSEYLHKIHLCFLPQILKEQLNSITEDLIVKTFYCKVFLNFN